MFVVSARLGKYNRLVSLVRLFGHPSSLQLLPLTSHHSVLVPPVSSQRIRLLHHARYYRLCHSILPFPVNCPRGTQQQQTTASTARIPAPIVATTALPGQWLSTMEDSPVSVGSIHRNEETSTNTDTVVRQVQPLRISKSASTSSNTSSPTKMPTPRPLAEIGSTSQRRNSPSYNQATRVSAAIATAAPNTQSLTWLAPNRR